MKQEIKFGTDGWRGIVGFDYTEEKIKIISSGICDYLKDKHSLTQPEAPAGGTEQKDIATDFASGGRDQEPYQNQSPNQNQTPRPQEKTPKVVVGYDTRFLSDRFAKTAAAIFFQNGISTCLSDNFVTTPALSKAVVDNKADLGIMITASHNPFYYNGYKIKGSYGGSATMDIVKPIEDKVNAILNNKEAAKFLSNNNTLPDPQNSYAECDFLQNYKKYVLSLVDTDIIKKNFNFPVVIDAMYGAGQGLCREIYSELSSSEIIEIHGYKNTSFGTINPEPIGNNLNGAVKTLKEKKSMLAICLDGDGDRIGAIGENGNFVSSHHIFAILLKYLVKYNKLSGKVVKTVSTSSIIDRICAKYGLELLTRPIGFKYISEEILAGGVIMGGEESGGLWVNGYMPERDGIFMGLKLIEVLCRENKSVNEVLKDIYNEFGYFVYRRADYDIDNTRKERLRDYLSKNIPDILKTEMNSKPVMIDGFKYILKDGSWIMIRPSGTEAVIRIYAESDTTEKLDILHNYGKKIMESV
jgi:phosphomannomutase